MTTPATTQTSKPTTLEQVVVRFAGDSGDGMQLTGNEFTKAAARAGNDIATFPDFPAEIRAPAGTLAGVSGFQVHFSSSEIYTAGDAPDVLVAMNPAALKRNIRDLVDGGLLIINSGTFTKPNLTKAGYTENPLDEGSSLYDQYRCHPIDITRLTNTALEETGLTPKEKARCKNFFALGLMFWTYSRDHLSEVKNIEAKFASKPQYAAANVLAFKAGYHYGETAEVFQGVYEVKPATFAQGTYRNITGNEALALGFVVAGQLADKPVFYSGYPITPASSLLHYLSRYKNYGVTTFQAEDEIAGIGAAIGAAFGGALALTASSGPGISLKGEGIALGAMTELPMVIVSVQRGGPSTGLPTKTEQSDLFQAIYGRNGDCPLPVIAAKTPGDAFSTALEAVRIATKYVTPVILLSDGYIASGAEPWKVPDTSTLTPFPVTHRTEKEGFEPYKRSPETYARDWVVPGTPGLEHRLGGLEKDFVSGNVSYDPVNHERMSHVRAAKVEKIAQECGELDLVGNEDCDLLMIGWGGTFGSLRQAATRMQKEGKNVSHVHLHYLSPFNPRLGPLLAKAKKVMIAELNMGQLYVVLRAKYLVDAHGYFKVQGQPFKVAELITAAEDVLAGRDPNARTEGNLEGLIT